MRTCARCRTTIPQGRLDALPDTHTCVTCSGVQKYVGAMIYDHKTAGRWNFSDRKTQKPFAPCHDL